MASALVPTGIALYQTMFLYSGIDKVRHFDAKAVNLSMKVQERLSLQLPAGLAKAGMAGVVLLEILGSLVLILFAIAQAVNPRVAEPWKGLARITIILMLIFLSMVTPLYHFPDRRVIPFLSNVTTAAGFLLMWVALGL